MHIDPLKYVYFYYCTILIHILHAYRPIEVRLFLLLLNVNAIFLTMHYPFISIEGILKTYKQRRENQH